MMERLPKRCILRQLLSYDAMTGRLIWLPRSAEHFSDTDRFSAAMQRNIWNGKNAGKIAFGRLNANGRFVGVIFGKSHFAHRVIWKWVHDAEPATIDHINGDPADNRLANLRAATHSDQSKNRSLFRSNRSGVAGVSRTQRGRWKAQIGATYLGCFATIEEAAAVRRGALAASDYASRHGTERIPTKDRTAKPLAKPNRWE